jgi:hypothetical protein
MDTKQSTQDDVKILFFFYSWSFGVLLWEIESGGITEPINNQVKFIQGCLVLFYQSSIQNGHFNAPLHGWTMLNKNFRQHQLTQCMHAQTRPTMLHPSTLDIAYCWTSMFLETALRKTLLLLATLGGATR